ncbi:hypothetical protein MFLAVUS_007912 [Mucor flavus]|uniref:F-box domain-containing protein n=1 Tax=Mucor flavus TaxID=439312 RepID=A0ABP9Z5L3_9FUNG
MPFQDVPSEVLDKIFLLLPNSVVRECIFVCKSWSITATRIFYSTISLTRTNTHKFISRQHASFWIRQLSFDIDFPQLFKFTPQQFKTLLDHIPSIKILDLTGLSRSVQPFLEILYKTDKLRCIEEIKVDDNLSMQSREIHVLTAYKYRDTMTHLHLNYLRYTTDGNYLAFLPQFKHLTFLSISNDLLNGDRYMLISSVLDVCPKLVGFGLQTKRHFPDASKAGLLKMMEQDDGGTKDRNLKLKRLYFELHDFHEAYMKYVIYYTRLDLLCLNMIDTDIYEWLSDKESMIHLFAKHLSTIKNLTITAQPNTNKRQRTSIQDRMERNWMFLDMIIGSKKLDCHVNLSMKGYDDLQKFNMNIINHQKIILEYQLKPEYPINNLTCLFSYGNGASIINSIEIGDAVRYTLSDCHQVIECAINKCPQLGFMIIRRAELCYRFEAVPYPYNIQFDKRIIEPGEGRNYSVATGVKLNHVLIQCATISKELIQVLCRCLGKIKVLKLKKCVLVDKLDIRGIEHLDYLELDAFTLVKCILLRLEMSGIISFYQSIDGSHFKSTKRDESRKQDTFYIHIQCDKVDRIVIRTTVCASVLLPVVQHE